MGCLCTDFKNLFELYLTSLNLKQQLKAWLRNSLYIIKYSGEKKRVGVKTDSLKYSFFGNY